MNINNKFVYIVMYDVPACENMTPYNRLRKAILNMGGMMLQESVYIIHTNTKSNAKNIKNQLSLIAPTGSNIRGVLITNEMFENLDIISGELTIGEKIISKRHIVIEI